MKQNKIDALFVNGPFLPMFSRESRSPAVTKSGTLYYPAWLAYACGYAEDNGFVANMLDCVAEKMDFDTSVRYVVEKDPGLIIIGTSTPSIEADGSFAKRLKEALPESKICMVGTHVSATAEETLNNYPWVDLIARREYDQTILELLQRLKNGEEYFDCLGVSCRVDGRIHESTDRKYLDNLDSLPFASRVYKDHLNIRNYYYGHVKFPMVSIFTSRGCNAKCFYCVYPQSMFGKFRCRSPQNIAMEFKWISENLPKVREVLIDDDTFTMKLSHTCEVSRELIKINNRLPWTCQVRATLDFKTLDLMKKAGCRLVVVGFESIDQNVLANVNKGIKRMHFEDFTKAARKAKVKVHGCFMAGNPGDTIDTLNATLDWAINQNLDTAQFFPLQLYPGTTAYKMYKTNGLLKQQPYRMWVTEEGMHNMTLMETDTGMTEQQILNFCDEARRKFYLRPSFIFKKCLDLFHDPAEFMKNLKGFINIRKHLFAKVSETLAK